MLERISRHIRANAVGYLALFVALSGTALASGVLNKAKVNKIISNRAPGLTVGNANTLAGSPASALTVGNANALGGSPASSFVHGPPEALRVVGTPGNPGLGSCATGHNWQNNTAGYQDAAFYRDPGGVVHITGAVFCAVAPTLSTIFTLPPGYTPAVTTGWFPTVDTNPTLRPVLVDSAGRVALADTAPSGDLFLDAIAFRCGPSGANGCP